MTGHPTPRVYLAGAEVFLPDTIEVLGKKAALARVLPEESDGGGCFRPSGIPESAKTCADRDLALQTAARLLHIAALSLAQMVPLTRSVAERGLSVAQAARDLDVAESVLRRWMRELTAAPAAAFPENGQMRADLAEIAALKKKVAGLRAERDMSRRKRQLFFGREG